MREFYGFMADKWKATNGECLNQHRNATFQVRHMRTVQAGRLCICDEELRRAGQPVRSDWGIRGAKVFKSYSEPKIYTGTQDIK